VLTQEVPNLPTDIRAGGSVVERVAILEREHQRLIEAIRVAFDQLNRSGALRISEAEITASHGIKFPATQNASSDVNTLDDYEEGTWTPALVGSTTAGSQSYTYQTGTYTKVGRLVVLEAAILLSAKGGTMAGDVRITGLPFTAGNSSQQYSLAVGLHQQFTLSAGYTDVTAAIPAGQAYIDIKQNGSGVNSVNLTAAAVANSTAIWVTGAFFV